MEITITEEDIYSNDALNLIEELSDQLAIITGDSGRSNFDLSDINNPRSLFVMVRENQLPVGCGAFRELSYDTAEVKRMYVRKKSSGIGNLILAYLEQRAKDLDYKRLILETRKCNKKAVSFYERNRYNAIPNYGRYEHKEESLCFEKVLL